MNAVDTNILVYAHRADGPFHDRARDVVRELVEGDSTWGIPWPCVHEFFAKVTHPRIFKVPSPLERALEQVSEWLRSPVCIPLGEIDGYLDLLASTLRSSKVVGAKVHDARIAAICMAHGVETLWSADRDFGRFSDLKVENPLV